MAYEGFDWDKHNLDRVAKHRITREKVGEVMRNGPTLYSEEVDERTGEERITELGHTDAVRVVYVAWTPRGTHQASDSIRCTAGESRRVSGAVLGRVMNSMDEKENQLPPMTQEQIEAEAAYAEKIYQQLSNEPVERTREILKPGRRPKAESLGDPEAVNPTRPASG